MTSYIPAKMIEGKNKKFSVKPIPERSLRFYELVARLIEGEMRMVKRKKP